MKAIEVKYLPCTNNKPSRWKAFAWGGVSVTLSYDHALNSEDNARKAAEALREKMSWKAEISGSGQLANGNFVFTMSHK